MAEKKKKYKYKKASFVIGYKPDGTPVRKYVYGKTVPERNAKLAEAKRRYARGLHLGEMTVTEWSVRWKTSFIANVSDNQKSHYESKLKHDILPAIGMMRMADVRASHLLDLINSYKGGKHSTVSKISQAISRMFDDAVVEGIIERNPSASLELPETIENARRPLTEDERNIVLEVAKTHKQGAYVLTMLYSGLRRGECIALTRADIDLGSRKINVDKSLTFEDGNMGKLSGTKASKLRKKTVDDEEFGARIAPMPDLLYTVMVALCEGKAHADLLFARADGSPDTKSSVTWRWNSFKNGCHREAGAKIYRNEVLADTSAFDDNISPHYLRHTYATDLYAAGVDVYARKLFLGHAKSDVTESYTAMPDEAFDRNLELINLYLNAELWGKNEVNKKGDKS
jgi:integrase